MRHGATDAKSTFINNVVFIYDIMLTYYILIRYTEAAYTHTYTKITPTRAYSNSMVVITYLLTYLNMTLNMTLQKREE